MICRMKNTSTRKLLSVRQGERMGKVQKGCEEAYPGAGRVYVNETGCLFVISVDLLRTGKKKRGKHGPNCQKGVVQKFCSHC